ncbi:zinc-dependent alcohol dehydrogenase family protein [Nocardiopsis tropica]|uniref:Zinc-dependent alcohol dehydrogenase family protein n=1 Tax=Nocardiopsis tropica TaxID=109330 RepID=A0ABU7KPI1_9ACTN|nr:zinc-dependent alcohol dehydrogenase family protein [Nocardiopsis umidischolae]MEE2051188.1 zinc-dependent alcohol dehydrogenase family protein [Nocardiopsis umidischolae]
MRALVVSEPGHFSLERVEDPAPGPREVVVAPSAVGVCGTDLHIIDGEFAPTPYPIVPGHEFAGTVVALGSEVTGLDVDDRVAVDPSLFCGACSKCVVGRGNLCESWNAIGVTGPGACAELAVAPAASCYPIPEHMPFSHGALIEPLSCAVHGFDLLPGRVGEHYLVYGAGTMGLLMAQLARSAGAASVSVVDPNKDRLAVAASLGADAVAPGPDELDRRDWEVVVDCTGVVAAIEDGLTRVARGGTFQVFGVAPAEATASFSPFRVYNDEITVVGSMAVLHSYGRAVDLMAKGVVDADAMVTDTFALDGFGDAVDAFRAGRGRKLQINPQL